MNRKQTLTLLLASTSLAAVGTTLNAIQTVTMNGAVLTTRAKSINGEIWVPLDDIAKTQGFQIVKNTNSYDLVRGTGGIMGQQGKVGDTLQSGKFKLVVNKFAKVSKFTVRNKTGMDYSVWNGVADMNDQVLTAKPGFSLYYAKVTLTNSRSDAFQFDWNVIDNKSAVRDQKNGSNPWLVYDIPSPAFCSSPILPGSQISFRICFAVAKGAKPKDILLMMKALEDSKPENFIIDVTQLPATQPTGNSSGNGNSGSSGSGSGGDLDGDGL